jgi:hypothetical protein
MKTKKLSLSFLVLFGSFLISQSAIASNPVESLKTLHQFAQKHKNDRLCDCNCNCGNGNIDNGTSGNGVGNGGGNESGGSSGNDSGNDGDVEASAAVR